MKAKIKILLLPFFFLGLLTVLMVLVFVPSGPGIIYGEKIQSVSVGEENFQALLNFIGKEENLTPDPDSSGRLIYGYDIDDVNFYDFVFEKVGTEPVNDIGVWAWYNGTHKGKDFFAFEIRKEGIFPMDTAFEKDSLAIKEGYELLLSRVFVSAKELPEVSPVTYQSGELMLFGEFPSKIK
jgi:hypothetical protein